MIYLTAPIFGRPDAIMQHKGLCISAGPEEGRRRVSTLGHLFKAVFTFPHCSPYLQMM